jgi:CHAT domain-containing protein/tetratricopeptide (TPR) repeat protein
MSLTFGLNQPPSSGFFEAPLVCRRRFVITLLILLVAAFSMCAPFALAQNPATAARNEVPTRRLSEGTTVSHESAETQTYQFDLRADEFVDLLINKGDLNLSAAVFTPKGELLGEFLSSRYEPLRVAFVSEEAGPYRLEIRSREKNETARLYDLRVAAQRVATGEDRRVAAAVRSCAEAAGLRAQWRELALREAISKYLEALTNWQAAGQRAEAARTLESIGDIYFGLSENRQALSYYLQALKVAHMAEDRRTETLELNKVGYVHVYLGKGKTALDYSARALRYYSRPRAKAPDADDRRGEAEARNSAGEAHYSLGNPRKSIDFFSDALTLWKAAGDRSGQALGNLNLGYAYSDLGDLPNARQRFDEALALSREVDDRRGEAQALTGLGTVHAFLGEKQTALDRHAQAMDIFRAIGDREGQAVALNSIGQAYEDLNELRTALDNYNRALQIYQERAHRDFEAVTRYYLGRVHDLLGEKDAALEFFKQSIFQGRQSGQKRVTAYALSAVSALRSSQGHRQEALGQLNQVLSLYRSLRDRRGEVNTLNNIGDIYNALGKKESALAYYKQALPLSRTAGDRYAEAATLYNLARVKKESGALKDALLDVKDSIRVIESLRAQIISPELRASYFASVYKHFELYIDLLMRLDELEPDKGFAAAALQASENARARALFEILGEAGAHIRQGVDEKLLERERALQQLLSAKAAHQMRVLSSDADAEEVEETNRELRDLNSAHQEVETQIKQQSPRYATLVQPQPLHVEDIQAELRDADTLLLEYALGEERSYLWAVTANSVAGYQLPGRAEIEGAARDLYKLLTMRQALVDNAAPDYQERVAEADNRFWQEAADLSQKLLGPVAAQLGKNRLLIVADGELQYLPFGALPRPRSPASEEPTTDYNPLMLSHEFVNLPSASTLAVIRRGPMRIESGRKLVAVLADPVFESDDPRLNQFAKPVGAAAPTSFKADFAGNARSVKISRLSATRQEAEAIMTVVPAGAGLMATDFNASRAMITNGELGQYRILHFATHGIINREHPELSGIMLSLLNNEGQSEDGFLQLHDIYNLELSGTQLVVLSACRTGLGKEVKGEGLVGLTRGFMYAGSPSVIASLWKVDDRATAELMKHFYQAMFDERLPPAAALRKAQEAMWQQPRYRAPFFWAAFVLQGEYRDPIAMPPPTRTRTYLLLSVAILALTIGSLYGLIIRRRNRMGHQR